MPQSNALGGFSFGVFGWLKEEMSMDSNVVPASMKMWWQPSLRRFGFADADVIVDDVDIDEDVTADVRVIGAGSNSNN